MSSKIQRVIVIGASGGTGRETVERLLAQGHEVTAFSRKGVALKGHPGILRVVKGDATKLSDVEEAVKGHDAVIVTLGIAENPLRVRFIGAAKTAMNVRSYGTRNVIAAMKKHKIKKLVVQTSYGVGETKKRLRFMDRLFFRLLLKQQIADTELQEEVVRRSDVDWVLAQPVHLNDNDESEVPFVSLSGEVKRWKVSRKRIARFLVDAIKQPDYVRRSVALSG